jgi:glutaryl-CoA dehydrogenase
VLPAINDYWEAAELPWPLMRLLADLGLYGEDITRYGCNCRWSHRVHDE